MNDTIGRSKPFRSPTAYVRFVGMDKFVGVGLSEEVESDISGVAASLDLSRMERNERRPRRNGFSKSAPLRRLVALTDRLNREGPSGPPKENRETESGARRAPSKSAPQLSGEEILPRTRHRGATLVSKNPRRRYRGAGFLQFFVIGVFIAFLCAFLSTKSRRFYNVRFSAPFKKI